MNSLMKLRWYHGGRNVSSPTSQRGGKITKSTLASPVGPDGDLRALADLSLEDLQGVDGRITADVFDVLSVEASVASRTSFGGTAPDNVRAAAAEARARFLGSHGGA